MLASEHVPNNASGAVQVVLKGHCNHWNVCEGTGKYWQQQHRMMDAMIAMNACA